MKYFNFKFEKETRKVYSWGRNQSGQLGLGNNENQPIPSIIESLNEMKVISINAGSDSSYCIIGIFYFFILLIW